MLREQRVRRETIRWLLLKKLDRARPKHASETALLTDLRQHWPDSDLAETRRELDYLKLRGLLVIKKKAGTWLAKLTREGIDLVEYTSTCDPGIARPEPV